MALTAKQSRFVDEYLIDLNATQAALRAGYSKRTAGQIGDENLKKPEIQKAIQQRMQERQARTQISADMVLRRWWEIATADPNELVSYRRVCCRHCFGVGHKYQWADELEYQRAAQQAEKDAAEADRHAVPPSDEGGYGFDRTLRPHPKCPECKGEGHGEVFVNDTRDLPAAARPLYAGVKVTKDGLEVKLQDQGKALENVARHLGMFNDKKTLLGPDGGPIQMVGRIELVSMDDDGED
ncbi:hypothetical protein ACG97_05925 [Vogesella sp. EB]|uniref:terminase small subunit n=1 Tax=Vogesella sp. EB TaxID=1526735 RepID=UPI00064D625C|nr:terminase small subunit [Vogesella sp. EB]KMJ53784.1 hypothetical protein ACG97_05925 [Vogesella sp. EB]